MYRETRGVAVPARIARTPLRASSGLAIAEKLHEHAEGVALAYVELFTMPDGLSYTTSIVVTFGEQGGKTLMTLEQTGFPNVEQRDGHQGGWPGFIDRLERVVVKRRAA